MKTKILILGVLAIASQAGIALAQGKGGGANTGKIESVTGINIVLLDPGGSPTPMITWNAIDKATYQVQRSKVGDACCNNASQPGLAVTSWKDSPLPSSGTYVYRVIATLKSGDVIGVAQLPYTAPMRSGRYRVSIVSIQVAKPTMDEPTGVDGIGDEIYASASVVRVDRATASKLGVTVLRSREYGDIGNGSSFPNRIRAGSASPSGGLAAGNSVGDPGTPGAETFPLVLWEGTLSDGGEAVVVVPSIWERDADDRIYRDYSANWQAAQIPFLGSQVVASQYSTATLSPGVAPMGTGQIGQGVTGPIYGADAIGVDWLSGVDRMIGIMSSNGTPIYPERFVVLTEEKLASIAMGGNIVLQIPLNENIPPGGSYTIIMRIERIG